MLPVLEIKLRELMDNNNIPFVLLQSDLNQLWANQSAILNLLSYAQSVKTAVYCRRVYEFFSYLCYLDPKIDQVLVFNNLEKIGTMEFLRTLDLNSDDQSINQKIQEIFVLSLTLIIKVKDVQEYDVWESLRNLIFRKLNVKEIIEFFELEHEWRDMSKVNVDPELFELALFTDKVGPLINLLQIVTIDGKSQLMGIGSLNHPQFPRATGNTRLTEICGLIYLPFCAQEPGYEFDNDSMESILKICSLQRGADNGQNNNRDAPANLAVLDQLDLQPISVPINSSREDTYEKIYSTVAQNKSANTLSMGSFLSFFLWKHIILISDKDLHG
jgi:hypothetical protein